MTKTEQELKLMKTAIENTLKYRYKPQQEWEDKHPILATLIITFAIIFRPITILLMGLIIILAIII